VCEKKNENEDEAENEGPRTNRRGEVLMSSVKMWRRGGRAIKTSERCRGCLALFDTFASDDSSPFAVPSPFYMKCIVVIK
jgi:hypothetical protein